MIQRKYETVVGLFVVASVAALLVMAAALFAAAVLVARRSQLARA